MGDAARVGGASSVERWCIGVRGASWRAEVDDAGTVHAAGARARWAVLAEDGWHDPTTRPPSVRGRRLSGAPVAETRVKVPGGDVVCTAWAAPERGGIVVLEWHNESPRAVAVAIDGDGVPLVASRAASAIEAAGLAWSAASWALPHATSLRAAWLVGVPRATGAVHEPWVAALADASRVVGAWREVAHGAGRVDLPDPRAAEALVAARCDLVLDDALAARLDDPVDALLYAAEAARLREPARAEPWEVADWCGAVARRVARRGPGGSLPTRREARALVLGAWTLAVAGERAGAADVAALAAGLGDPVADPRPPVADPRPPAADAGDAASPRAVRAVRAIAAIEDGLARVGADGTLHLLPDGVPASWRGVHFEAHGLVAGAGRRVSYAVRWHGAAPALLWDVEGDARGLAIAAPRVDPQFATREPRGETLLREPGPVPSTPHP